MGLTVRIKGYPGSTINCGYMTFGVFRQRLAEVVDEELGILYGKWYDGTLTEEEVKRANKILRKTPGIDKFLSHADCEGCFSIKSCAKIYSDMKDIHMDMTGCNYGETETFNMLERWKELFKWCAENGRVMRFE